MRVLLFSSLLFTLGTLSFLRGFLSLTPLFTRAGEVKSASNEPRQKHKSDEGNPLQKCLEREGAPFDNLVFVLIDALRSDNVFPVEEGGSPMPFVQECVERGKAMGKLGICFLILCPNVAPLFRNFTLTHLPI